MSFRSHASQLVALPYQLLLSADSRQALDLAIDDQIIVIDEAHALIDTILNTRLVEMPLKALDSLTAAFQAYRLRFKSRLKGINLLHLSQTLAVLLRLQAFCTDTKTKDGLYNIGDITAALKLDQLPVRRICEWLRETKMAHKVSGLSESQAKKAKPDAPVAAISASSVYRLQSLLLALAEPDADGRVLILQQDKMRVFKYVLLNPQEAFRDLVQSSRAMVLAGGTMAPMGDFALQLFSYAKDRLATLSLGHIVPAKQLLVRSVSRGHRKERRLSEAARDRADVQEVRIHV
jgi:chromosome transmission fidelity protein 1